MTWFKVTTSMPPRPYEKKPVVRLSARGDRSLAFRVSKDQEAEVQKGKRTSAQVEKMPRGCLFKLQGGYFDLDGFWCAKRADRRVNVHRNAPRGITALLSDLQKKELHRVRLNAKRNGLR